MIALTGLTLTTFITGLNGGASIDATLLDVLVSNAKAVLEGERPWMVLRKTDTSKTVTTSNTWQTAIDLSTITDFSEFYSDTPVQLFDGTTIVAYYTMVPWDRRLEYKDASNTCVYDANTKQLYLNGTVPVNGTPYIAYKSTSTEIDLTSASVIWSLFPLRFAPILGYYAIGINKGAVDYDDIVKEMLPANQNVLMALKSTMENWDNALQQSSIEWNDPTGYGRDLPMGPRINRHQ
jgi:hypothetical protein